jgi:hypothetical protein
MNQVYGWIFGVLLLLFFVWLWWILRGTADADQQGLKYRLHRAWRRIAFWAGDVYVIWYFKFIPWFAWNHHEYGVGYEELLKVMRDLEPGDVMLATKDPYPLSNLAIPGCFKHAGIIVKGPHKILPENRLKVAGETDPPDTAYCFDPSYVSLVEAISEGVVRRSPLWARADKMIFLRPKHVRDKCREHAVSIAMKTVGSKYDASFKFDIEEELKWMDEEEDAYRAMDHPITGISRSRDLEALELARAMANIGAEYDMAFSCTEVVATSWWFRHRQLGIYRKRVRGRECIVADQFVNRDWHVVWTNVKAEEAEKAGMGEEGVTQIKEYWKQR